MSLNVHFFEGSTADDFNKQFEEWLSSHPGFVLKNLKLAIGEKMVVVGVIFEVVTPVKRVDGDAWRGDNFSTLSEILMDIGITPNLSGFRYTKTAIELIQQDETMLLPITGKLYPTIAEKHQSTPSRVERAMRHAIQVAWEAGKLKKIYPWFHSWPTNGEFLATLAEKLSTEKAG